MIFMVIFLIELIVVLLLYKKCQNRYEGLDELDEKEFPLKKVLPIGVFLVQEVAKYKFDKPRDIRTQSKLGQIYGAKAAATYLRINRAHQACMFIVGILIVTLLAGAASVNSVSETADTAALQMKGNEIERPAFGEGSKKVTVEGTLKNGEEKETYTYDITVAQQIPDDKGCVEYVGEKIEAYMLGENTDVNHITSQLKMPSKFDSVGVTAKWKVDDTGIINAEGVVARPENGQGDKKTKVEVTLSKGEVKAKKTFNLTVLEKQPMSAQQEMEYAAEQINTNIENINAAQTEEKVVLPEKIKNVTVKWKEIEEQGTNSVQIFVIGIIFVFLVVLLNEKTLDEKIQKRREAMQIDYPEFLNKLIILLTSGATMPKALEKIALDYSRIRQKTGRKKPLYEELLVMVNEVNGGQIFSQAINDFALRCKTREILKFASIVEMTQKKGGGELIATLKGQSAESWEMRKHVAKRRGEEASTKLLAPLMLMLVGILLIVMTPAVLSLSGI